MFLSVGVSQKEKMLFAERLSLMLKGGVSITEALEILKSEMKSRTFKKALDDILTRVLEGEDLSESIGHYPKIFSEFFRSVIKIGEESGTLEENLRRAADQLKKDYTLRKRVKGAFVYPIFVIVLALVIVFGALFFILPKVTNLFQLFEIELPLATRILITSSSFSQKYWPLILGGIILFILILRFLQNIKFIRFYSHGLILSFPFFGKVVKNLYLARFSRTFYNLFKSGIPLPKTLQICIDILPNEVYKKNLFSVKSEVEQGGKISQALRRFPRSFPLVFSGIVLAGEKSGSLEEGFLYLAEFYEKEVDSILKDLSSLLEPALLILVGIFVGFVSIAIIIPIYRFIGSLSFR